MVAFPFRVCVYVWKITIKIQDYLPKYADFTPCHSLQSLESLTERCENALSLLGEALQAMDSEPMPDNIKVEGSIVDLLLCVCRQTNFTLWTFSGL